MKKELFDIMLKLMEENKDIVLIFAGLGWPRITEFLEKYPDRAINTEASEQTALDMAVGLAYAGKVPFVYTITPFLYRAWETLRTYLDHESLNVKLIGAGRDGDYSDHGDGFSHDARDISEMLSVLKNFKQYYPVDKEAMEKAINEMIKNTVPCFLSIRR